MKEGVKNFGRIFKAILTGDLKAIPGIIKEHFEKGMENATGAIDSVRNKFGEIKDVITENISQGVENALRGKKYELLPDAIDVTAASEKVADEIAGGGKGGGGRAKASALDTSGLTSGGVMESPLKLAAETIGMHVKVISDQQKVAMENAVAFKEGF